MVAAFCSNQESRERQETSKEIVKPKRYLSIGYENNRVHKYYQQMIFQILTFLFLINTTQSYPTNIGNVILQKNDKFKRQTYNINSTTDFKAGVNDGEGYYQSDIRIIDDFLASRHKYLQSLVCMSQMQSYKFDEVSDLLVFSLQVNFEANSPDLASNKSYYKVRMMDTFHNNSHAIKVRVDMIFFSTELELMFDTMDVPLFYSFKVKNDEFRVIDYNDPNNNYELNLQIKLPLAIQDEDFLLPQAHGNYRIVGYLTGIDLNQSANCWAVGAVTTTTLTSRNDINVRLQFSRVSSCNPSRNAFLKSFTLNVFIFHPSGLVNTQHFIYAQNIEFTNSVQYHSFQLTNKDISQCQYMTGLTGAYTNSILNKFQFIYQIDQQIPSDKSKILFTQKYPNLLEKNTNYFVIFGRVMCGNGEFYNLTSGNCENNSTWPVNYFIVANQLYSQTTYQPCVTPCIFQPTLSHHTCRDTYGIQHQCQPCTLPQQFSYPIFDINNPFYQQCKTCSQIFNQPQCLYCTVNQCTKCANNKVFVNNRCEKQVEVICDDGQWMPQRGEECDNLYNGEGTGCLPVTCKIEQGFTCPPPIYPILNQPSVCYYTKPLTLSFINIFKQEFSNTLHLQYFITNPFWNQSQSINKSLSISSSILVDNLTVKSIQYFQEQQRLLIEISYDNLQNVQDVYIMVENDLKVVNNSRLVYDSSNGGVTTNQLQQQVTTTITYQMLDEAYFLTSHSQQQYEMAKYLAICYLLAGVIGLVFIVLGLIGGKYIAIQISSILQLTYLGLLMLDRYTPMYLAVNRLAIVAGEVMFNKNDRQFYQYSQLNTLKLRETFLQNCNVQLAMFLVCVIAGVLCLILQKVIKSTKAMILSIIGSNLLGQYALYGLLVWGYVIPLSLGLQIRYQLLQKLNDQQQVNFASSVIGLLSVIVMLIYAIVYFKHPNRFGQFYREMIKFAITENLIVLVILQKVIVGLGLGLFHKFQYVGFVLGGIEIMMIVIVRYTQPFYYQIHDNRFISSHFYLAFVLIVYNIHKLFYTNETLTQTNPWFFQWPLIFVILIYAVLIKNAFFMVKQFRVIAHRLKSLKLIYQEYVRHQQDKDKIIQEKNQNQDKLLLEAKFFLEEGEKKFQLTDYQIRQWKNFTKVNSRNGLYDIVREKTKNNKYVEEEQLINGDFRAKISLKRLDKTIKKKVQKEKQKQKLSKQQKSQKKQKQSNSQQQIHEQEDQKNIVQEIQQQEQNLSDRELLHSKNDNIFIDQQEINDSFQNIGKKNKRQNNESYVQKTKPKQKKENNVEYERDIIEQTYFKKQKKKVQQEKRLITSKQYEEKIKNMTYYDHWDEIDTNAVKFQLLQPDNVFKPFSFDTKQKEQLQEQNKFIGQVMQKNEKPKQQKFKKQIPKKIMYRGGFKFSQLSKQINSSKN